MQQTLMRKCMFCNSYELLIGTQNIKNVSEISFHLKEIYIYLRYFSRH